MKVSMISKYVIKLQRNTVAYVRACYDFFFGTRSKVYSMREAVMYIYK